MNYVPSWHHIPANPYNPHAWIIGDPEIGPDCWIGPFTILDGSGGLRIGQGCHISAGAQIYTHTTVNRVITEGTIPTDRAPTVIGDFVHIGAGAIILMGTTIGSRSCVGAGSVVTQYSEFPDGSAIIGNPAKSRDRDSRR